MASQTTPDEVLARITEFVGAAYAPDLVAVYFDPARGFAGATFDGLDQEGFLADNPAGRFTSDDIVAASLLDVRYGPNAVRALLGSAGIADALEAVPESVPLWDMDDEVYTKANELWGLVSGIGGMGRTRTSKLLARKRPELVPIVDSVIADSLQLRGETWRPLAHALQDHALRVKIDQLRPVHTSESISTLRLLDVVVWMSCSRSGAAVRAQIECGAPPARDLP